MTFERSKDKVRPTNPRSSDARAAEAVEKPTDARTSHGHFAAGNRSGVGARFIAATKKSLGDGGGDAESRIVVRDAKRIGLHILRALPSSAPPVRVLVMIHARHVALHAYFTCKAEAAGLDTPTGLSLLVVADRQSQRAERTLVTAQDMARVCAEQERKQALVVLDPHATLMSVLAEGER